ncbi:MAG: hypothetical protein IJI09_09705 [Clostridia bacterium]|nr:hypothetical protein [Clostridia bacterium]
MAGICIDKELTRIHIQFAKENAPTDPGETVSGLSMTMKSPTGTGAAPCRRPSAFSQNLLVKGRFFPYNTNTYISQERRRGT